MTNPQKGAAAAFFAYLWWGSMPFYWKALQSISSSEILGHRVVWSAAFTLVLTLLGGRLGSAVSYISRNKKNSRLLFIGGYLITLNWGLYVWAINVGRILETSLGYYINPLVSMLFGTLLFSERLRAAQKAAIATAVAGVCLQIAALGEVPLVSLGIALTFGLYGAMKKAVALESRESLFIETISVAPAALVYLLYLQFAGRADFPYDPATTLLLAGTGVMTSVPLLLFAFAAHRVRLTTIGFIQYVSPTMTFLIGTFVYREGLSIYRLATFCCIWAALAIYSADAVMAGRKEKRAENAQSREGIFIPPHAYKDPTLPRGKRLSRFRGR